MAKKELAKKAAVVRATTKEDKKTALDGALKQTKRMLEADYRTAIPQYYNHSIQLLLPICLRHPGKPDLALACMKTSDGSKYLGRTCLTLRMAYHNARLLARVDRSWLMTSVSA